MRRPKIILRILDALELQPMSRMDLERVLCIGARSAEQPLQELARLGAIVEVGRRPGSGQAKVWGLA